LFEEQVEKTPDAVALCLQNPAPGTANTGSPFIVSITYREMNLRANRLARHLGNQGIAGGEIVGLLMDRTAEMVTALMAILKAGGAYMPIDPHYPADRIAYMLKDSNTRLLVTSRTLDGIASLFGGDSTEAGAVQSNALGNFSTLCSGDFIPCNGASFEKAVVYIEDVNDLPDEAPVSDNPESTAKSTDIVYIIYTSGTTGRPKGVAIEHKNVVRLLFNDKFQFDFSNRDTWTMFHSHCFDFSVWEMYGALLYGGKLLLIPQMLSRTPSLYLRALKENSVTILNQTPTAFYNLMDEEMSQKGETLQLRYIIFGGEALNPGRLRQWHSRYPAVKLVNMFGITETTVHVTYKEITGSDIQLGISNIGTPIPTLSTYILDPNLALVPMGTTGELCVAGDGVGRGYLNRPQETSEKFVKNPFKKDQRLYRSGDTARYLASGQMEYLGRIDRQLQLRGFRTEPAEIEIVLTQNENIADAAVTLVQNKNDEKTLLAYLVPRGELNLEGLRSYLAGKLPHHMIPAHFIQLTELPLNANGKLDRRALDKLGGPHLQRGVPYAAPGNDIEETLVEIWQEVLKSQPIGINDNYFSLGGDSIKAIRLVGRINSTLPHKLEVKDIYLYPEIASMAAYIMTQASHSPKHQIESTEDQEEIKKIQSSLMRQLGISGELLREWEGLYPAGDIEKLMITYSLRYPGSGMYHDQFVYPIETDSFDFNRFKTAFRLMVEKHSTLRTSYDFSNPERLIHIVHTHPAVTNPLEYEDISHLARPRQEDYLENYLENDRRQPFAITEPGLWRLRVFRLSRKGYCILWRFHHAILDGWSNASIWTELSNIYFDLEKDPALLPSPLMVGYGEYIALQMRTNRAADLKDFWREKLSDFQRTPLPLGKTIEPADWDGRVETHAFTLGRRLSRKLQQLAQQEGTTLKAISLAAFVFLVSAATSSHDITVGLMTNCRPDIEDGDKIAGCFLNMIPFRISPAPDISAYDLVKSVTAGDHELKAYDKLSLLEINRLLGQQDKKENPIFDMLFNFVDFHIYGEAHQKTHTTREVIVDTVEGMHTYFDFVVGKAGEQLKVIVRSCAKLYSHEEFKIISDYYTNILKSLTGRTGHNTPIREIIGTLPQRGYKKN
ncbi:MAG: amino acid adenylation domain-containing protein, partial [bacterium]|nr:amino acid adenylation domain-containing protein [bacterium]